MKLALHSTRTCGRHSHPEIVVALDETSGLVPEWLIQYFETAVGAGQIFKAGQTVQVGGGVLRMQAGASGTLEAWEPDFRSMPIQWVRGANETLRQLILQQSVAGLVTAQPDFASILHAAQVQEGWLGLRVLEMRLNIPEDNHTGWSIETPDRPPPNQLVSIYDVGRRLPVCVPFFALPTGAHVEISPEHIVIEFAGRSVSSANSTLLKALLPAESR